MMFNVRTKNKPLLSSLSSNISILVKNLLYNNLVSIPNWKAWYFKDEEGIPDGCENSDQVNILIFVQSVSFYPILARTERGGNTDGRWRVC